MYIRALATGLCGFLLLTPVHAQEPPSPCGSPVAVPDKPLLEDYPDYSNFLLQIMKYNQAQRDQAAHRNACPDDYLPQPMASSDPTDGSILLCQTTSISPVASILSIARSCSGWNPTCRAG